MKTGAKDSTPVQIFKTGYKKKINSALEVAQEFFDLKNSWATSKTRVTNGSLRRLFFVTSRRILFRVSNEDRKFINFLFHHYN